MSAAEIAEATARDVAELDRLKVIAFRHKARRQGSSEHPVFPIDEPKPAA